VIVGARMYDNGQADEGRAFVYLGSAAGLATTAAWTAESNQAFALFGASVATAGDVNGDGYSDVIVGAYQYDNGQTDEGRAFVYLGSAAGLATTPAWTAESDQASAAFGSSVATAGDVNGDGYGDVIVGALLSENDAQLEEGQAFVYYGNAGPGLSLKPQQRRSDDASPVAHLGASNDAGSFRLVALGRSPFGRTRLKLEQEVKPLGTSFNGAGTQIAALWTDSGVVGAPLDEVATGLSVGTPYHWRVRLHYQPAASPFQQSSRWLTVPWKGWQEWMLRTAAPVVVSNAGRVPDGSSGAPLQVGKATVGQITLAWSASCLGTDTDYEIYEGTIGGSFTSHTSIFCSTSGETTQTFLVSPASTYYLVVPRNAMREGSYGLTSAGTERPQGAFACLPQQIASCP
jgi:hypothetical protein